MKSTTRNRLTFRSGVALLALLVAASGAVAKANLIANGDFESPNDTVVFDSDDPGDFPDGWAAYNGLFSCPASLQTGAAAIGGFGASALMKRYGAMRQVLDTPTGKSWIFEMDFATADPGSGIERSLHLFLEHGASSGSNDIIMRVVDDDDNGVGTLQVYNGDYPTVFHNVIPFSSDIETAPVVSHLKVVGDYASLAPRYEVFLTVDNTTYASGWLTDFRNAPTSNNQGLTAVSFSTSVSSATGIYLIDNLTVVPEPSSLMLLGVLFTAVGLAGWHRAVR